MLFLFKKLMYNLKFNFMKNFKNFNVESLSKNELVSIDGGNDFAKATGKVIGTIFGVAVAVFMSAVEIVVE